jgi:hypothetical protein
MAASATLANFVGQISALRATLLDADGAFNGRNLQVDSYYSVLELVHLQLVSLFETYLEDLFYDCALGNSGIGAAASVIPTATIEDVNMLVYSGGSRRQKFLSWLPYEETAERASVYLEPDAPFSRLLYRPVEKRAIKDAIIVRNAVAHASGHAIEQFQALARERRYPHVRPANYLVSTRAGATESALFFATFELIAEALAESTVVGADRLLNPERPFTGTEQAPAGDYECDACGYARPGHPGGKLGHCTSCGHGQSCPTCGGRRASSWRRSL